MKKKQESVLGLAPIDHGESGQIVPMSSVHPSNRDEQWILAEYQKQTFVMQGIKAKSAHAMHLIADIHKEGASTFEEATGYILAVKDGQRTKEHQAYVDEFCTREIQMLGRHMLATMEVGATGIGSEVYRSIYPPEEKKSLWMRLFS